MRLNFMIAEAFGSSVPDESSKLRRGIEAVEKMAEQFRKNKKEILDLSEQKVKWEEKYPEENI